MKAAEILVDEFKDIAAIIVEPLQRIIPPVPGFLEGLRELCNKNNILLIFDEIVTGFRLAYGGAQERYGVMPDICTLGKIIGGGFPLAALGAKKEIMKHFDKDVVGSDKWLMQLGTLSGNPIASVAGLKTMEILRRPGQYNKLREIGKTLQEIQSKIFREQGIPYQIVGDETLFDVIFTNRKCIDYRSTKHDEISQANKYNKSLREQGILKAPSKIYPSVAISEVDLEMTRDAVKNAVNTMMNS